MKKTFFHKFIQSKAEEEAYQVNNTPWVMTRELVEIRDVYLAPTIDLENLWQIKKKIIRNEIVLGKLVIPFLEMFEYILRYWKLDVAKSLANGYEVCVDVWDITEENDPQKYEGGTVCFRKLYNDHDYSLSCERLFNYRGLDVGDEIGLYWDPRSSSLMFKLLFQVRAQEFRTKNNTP